MYRTKAEIDFDRIAKNPFRMLGVCANSGVKESSSNIGKFRVFLSVGKPCSFATDFESLLGPVPRTVQDLERAALDVATPEKRLNAGMFWFFGNELFSGTVAKLLSEGLTDEAADVLKDAVKKSRDVVDLQNLMIVHVIRQDYQSAIEIAYTLYGPRCTEFQNLMTSILTVKKQHYVTEFANALHEQGVKIRDNLKKPELLKWKPWLELDDARWSMPEKAPAVSGQAAGSPASANTVPAEQTDFEKFIAGLYFIRSSDAAFESKSWESLLKSKETFAVSKVSDEDCAKAENMLKDFRKAMKSRSKKELRSQITEKSCLPVLLNVSEIYMAIAFEATEFIAGLRDAFPSYDPFSKKDRENVLNVISASDLIFRHKRFFSFWRGLAEFIAENSESHTGVFQELRDMREAFEAYDMFGEILNSVRTAPPGAKIVKGLSLITLMLASRVVRNLTFLNSRLQQKFLMLLKNFEDLTDTLSSMVESSGIDDDDPYDDDDDYDDYDDDDDYGFTGTGASKKKKRRKKAMNGRNGQKKKKKKKR